jgi:hypothetical protein
VCWIPVSPLYVVLPWYWFPVSLEVMVVFRSPLTPDSSFLNDPCVAAVPAWPLAAAPLWC